MSLDYNTYVSQIANLTVISSNDANFQTMLPGMIDYAEQRIYREADFLATVSANYQNCLAGAGAIGVSGTSSLTFLVIDNVMVSTSVMLSSIYQAASSNQIGINLTPLSVTSRAYIETVYISGGNTGFPQNFAINTNTSCLIGPAPDQNYLTIIVGTFRPAPLSSSNPSTYLTQSFPDLFVAASMVFASGYMRNFGSQADDGPMAMSWSKQYDTLFASAGMEEQRKKYGSQGWQSQIPNPIATPQRV